MSMNCLLHSCCGPCAVKCVEELQTERVRLSLFWYNPNIHPVTEYLSRREAFIQYAQSTELPYILKDEYGLRAFVSGVSPDFDKRCEFCYNIRLDAAAAYAAANGFDNFSTTLLISPWQNHDMIRAAAEEISQRRRIPFFYRDFRPLFREGQQSARDMGLYMQKYCGCIFSEEERYQKKILHLFSERDKIT